MASGDPNCDQSIFCRRLGWVDSPNTRGTADIIWPCVSTITLCLYTMLHLNIPAKDDSATTQCLRKLRWLVLSLLAPELPMLFAFAQRASAKNSVRGMKEIGYNDWSITHGFFADGGGFVLAAQDTEPFPVTSQQIIYLVKNGHIEPPKVTTLEINDKSKADTVAKALAAFQAIRLVGILIARAAGGLRTTPLELVSAAVVFCSMVTLGLWWEKPLDARVPVVIHTSIDVYSLSSTELGNTPLDFVEPEVYWSAKWSRRVQQLILRLGYQAQPFKRMSPNSKCT